MNSPARGGMTSTDEIRFANYKRVILDCLGRGDVLEAKMRAGDMLKWSEGQGPIARHCVDWLMSTSMGR